jgi:hypothetical protein
VIEASCNARDTCSMMVFQGTARGWTTPKTVGRVVVGGAKAASNTTFETASNDIHEANYDQAHSVSLNEIRWAGHKSEKRTPSSSGRQPRATLVLIVIGIHSFRAHAPFVRFPLI